MALLTRRRLSTTRNGRLRVQTVGEHAINTHFDPYHKWLGIPPAEQPPDLYRLLGVARFEADPDVISNAADQRMAHLRTFQTGRNSALSQQLLNQLAAARVVLLHAEKRGQYDDQLRGELEAKAVQTRELKPPPTRQGQPPAFPPRASSPEPSTSDRLNALFENLSVEENAALAKARRSLGRAKDGQTTPLEPLDPQARQRRRRLAVGGLVAAAVLVSVVLFRVLLTDPHTEPQTAQTPETVATGEAADATKDAPTPHPDGGTPPIVPKEIGDATGSETESDLARAFGERVQAESDAKRRSEADSSGLLAPGMAGHEPAAEPQRDKLPPPADHDLTAVQQLLEREYADWDIPRLIAQAELTDKGDTRCYAILALARDKAAGSGDVATALAATERIESFFIIDALEEKARLLPKVFPHVAHEEGFDELARLGMALIQEARSAGREDVARRCCEIALIAARKSGDTRLTAAVTLTIVGENPPLPPPRSTSPTSGGRLLPASASISKPLPGTHSQPSPSATTAALAFNGREYIETDLTYDGRHPITLEAIVRPDAAEDATVLGNCEHAGLLIELVNGYWSFTVHDRDTYCRAVSDEKAIVGQIIHLAGIYDGQALRLFVDGRLQRSSPRMNGEHRPSALPLFVGADPDRAGRPQHLFRGTIYAVQVSGAVVYYESFTPQYPLSRHDAAMLLLNMNEGRGPVSPDRSGKRCRAKIVGAEWTDAPAPTWDEVPAQQAVLDLSDADEAWAREWMVVATRAGEETRGYGPRVGRSSTADRRGILGVHPVSDGCPARLTRVVHDKPWPAMLLLQVIGDEDGDFVLLVRANGVPLGKAQSIGGRQGWREVVFDLRPLAGKAYRLEIEVHNSGWWWEHAYFDDIILK